MRSGSPEGDVCGSHWKCSSTSADSSTRETARLRGVCGRGEFASYQPFDRTNRFIASVSWCISIVSSEPPSPTGRRPPILAPRADIVGCGKYLCDKLYQPAGFLSVAGKTENGCGISASSGPATFPVGKNSGIGKREGKIQGVERFSVPLVAGWERGYTFHHLVSVHSGGQHAENREGS